MCVKIGGIGYSDKAVKTEKNKNMRNQDWEELHPKGEPSIGASFFLRAPANFKGGVWELQEAELSVQDSGTRGTKAERK